MLRSNLMLTEFLIRFVVDIIITAKKEGFAEVESFMIKISMIKTDKTSQCISIRVYKVFLQMSY